MKLTNQQLNNYIGRIKLTADMKRKYTTQIDNLIDELRTRINANTDMKVTRVIRAGSWKKGTALRPRPEHPLDIDLVFFLDLDGASAASVATLHDKLLAFLLKAYPTKKKEDFKGGEKTVGLVFRGSGLEADLVPVVPVTSNPRYVWQPSKRSARATFVTSVDGQIDFARACKKRDSNYTGVVRMLKAWKARKELDLSSFSIELIVAYLMDANGTADNIEDAVIRFFEFLSRDNLPNMAFASALGTADTGSGPAFLGDPTYNPNNVLARVKQGEWSEITKEANTAWETLTIAQTAGAEGRTVALWKEVFGPFFNITLEAS